MKIHEDNTEKLSKIMCFYHFFCGKIASFWLWFLALIQISHLTCSSNVTYNRIFTRVQLSVEHKKHEKTYSAAGEEVLMSR